MIMLVLTRRVGQILKIGDDVDIMVIGVKGNQIRFGIKAPRHISVHREEVIEKIKREEALIAPGDSPLQRQQADSFIPGQAGQVG
jgi:carbon storage regulator